MNCPKCGEVLEEGMRFCTKCGTNIEEAMKEEQEKIRKEAERLKKENEEREAKRLEYEKRERELREEAERKRIEEEKRLKAQKEEEERKKLEEERRKEELRKEEERIEEERKKLEEEKRKLEEDKLRAIREAEEMKRIKEENEKKEKLAEENAQKAIEVSEAEAKSEEPKKEEAPKEESGFKPAKNQIKQKAKKKGFIRRFFDRLILLIIIIALLIGGIYYLHVNNYLPEPISNEINGLIDQLKDVKSKMDKDYENVDEETSNEENTTTEEPADESSITWTVENTIEAEDIINLDENVSAIIVNSKYGIIDNKTGKILLDTNYENVEMVAGQIIVTSEGKTYSVDSKYQLGEETEIIQDIQRFEYLYNREDGKVYVFTGEKSLREIDMYITSDEIIICEEVSINEDDMTVTNGNIEIDYENIEHLGKYGCYSIEEGKMLTECIYDEMYNFSENYAACKRDNISGFVNSNGEEVKFNFEESRNVYNGIAWVKKDGKWGLANIAE